MARDVHSYARPGEARVTHVSLDLFADFEAKQFRGSATLDLDVAPGVSEVVLDVRDLLIHSAADEHGQPCAFTIGEPDPILGCPLSVEIQTGLTRILIDYTTGPDAAALLWLAPEQTAGGKHPFVFSQGHAILTRTWIPTQDSPGIRQTYDARITVPEDLVAVMSAEHLTPGGVPGEEGRRFEFRMKQPIPPHLFAIAIGVLSFRALGPRSGVFAEPCVVDLARDEFADLEQMMAAGEAVGGPYRWDRLDLLVLPPSFPFGGMENPRLTFVTPTLLAGDRSLTTIVAHELAHAWAGNLVTNATWSDFWLNEGFTVYMELRIMEALYGPERAAMLEVYGYRALAEEIGQLGPTSSDTKLHVDLTGRDPAAGVTTIPYVKGAAFLRVIEQAVGRERFDRYLRAWFDRHAFTSVTTEVFVRDLREHLLGGDPELEQRIGIEQWVYQPGLPDNALQPSSAALVDVQAQAEAFAAGKPAGAIDTQAWTPQEWRHFLGALPRELKLSQLDDLDRTFELSQAGNYEILFAWLRLAVRNQYEPAVPALERLLTTQGRRKFLQPLYKDLMATDWGRAQALRLYQRARPLYHATVTTVLDPIVR